MKLNGIEVNLEQMNTELVDDVFIIHDCTSKKVFLFDEMSSFVWKIILEYEKNGEDVDTYRIVDKILDVYDISEDRKQEICHDVEEIFSVFLDSGLLYIKSF